MSRKREAALENGATDVVDPSSSEAIDEVLRLTKGRGCDYAFEVAMSGSTLQQAYAMCRKGGTVVAVGMPPTG